MKLFLLTILSTLIISCGDNSSIKVQRICSLEGNQLACPNGETVELDDVSLEEDPQPVVLSSTIIVPGECKEITNDIYVENIRNGEIFDVYMDSSCQDRVNGELNEYCDNVETQYGKSGKIGQGKPGSATLCWVDSIQLSGIQLDNGDIELRILDFGGALL